MAPVQNLPFSALCGAEVQDYPIPEHSDYAHLLTRTFCVRAGAEVCRVPLLPGSGVTLLFPSAGQALLCGPLTALHHLSLSPGQMLYGVQLRCGCGDWLWQDSLHTLTDRTVALEAHLKGSNALCPALAGCESVQEQNSLFAALAAAHGALTYQPTPLLRRCIQLIESRSGQLRVEDLARDTGCSTRHLSRLLRQKAGLSAKAVCELAQLRHSLHTVLTTPSRSLLHLAVGCGYFDQAHMNRHYHRFLGCSVNTIRHSSTFPAGRELPLP